MFHTLPETVFAFWNKTYFSKHSQKLGALFSYGPLCKENSCLEIGKGPK